MVPVWLLDIDGVINAERLKPDTGVWPAPAWRSLSVPADDRVFPLLVATPVVDFINAVHACGAAEIRWHTTWQHWAVDAFAPAVGLPHFSIAPAPEYQAYLAGPAPSGRWARGQEPEATWWKVGAATRVVGDERRSLLWTDNDLDLYRNTGHLTPLHSSPQRMQLVSPHADSGLARKHLRSIASFLGLDPAVVPVRPTNPR